MKREELKKIYQPKAELETRVKSVLYTLEEKPERRMSMRRAALLAACMVMLVTAAWAGAAGMLFSDEYDAVRMAKRALAEEYGITEAMHTYFTQETREENGVKTIIFSGMEDMRHVLGEYTVIIREDDVSVSWSKDGQSTEGDLDAHAWGAGQIQILLDIARQEQGYAHGYRKAQEIRAQMEEDELTVTIARGSGAKVVALEVAQIDRARISVSEDEAIAIAQKAFAGEYGLTAAQIEAMQYQKDQVGYTYAVLNGTIVCEVWFWLHQNEEEYHTEGDGMYWARINAETGVVEEMAYDSALAGNG